MKVNFKHKNTRRGKGIPTSMASSQHYQRV